MCIILAFFCKVKDLYLYKCFQTFWPKTFRKRQLEEPENQHSLSVPTSICYIELDPKVSSRASRVVTGCEDDPAYGLDLPDDAGNSRGGQEAIVADDQATDLHATDMSEGQ